jgi:hypothetical protein
MVDIISVVNRNSARPVSTEDDAFKQDVDEPPHMAVLGDYEYVPGVVG